MNRGCSGSGSIFLRRRMIRRSTLRSNGSQSRCWFRFRMRSRESARFGMFGERLQQVELERRHRHFTAMLVGQPMRGEIEHAAPDAHARGADVGARARTTCGAARFSRAPSSSRGSKGFGT